MSIIMAVGNRHKLILASDGLVSDMDDNGNHVVLNEKFKKIFRLSSSVCVSIAGNRGQCMQIIHLLQANCVFSTIPQECANAISDALQSHMVAINKELNVKMILAGINFMKERELYLFSADNDNIEIEKKPLNDSVIYVAKGDIEKDETDYFYPILNDMSRDVKTNMRLCIVEAAKRNRTVNDVVFFEEL